MNCLSNIDSMKDFLVIAGTVVAIGLLAFLALCFLAWLLGVVLGWFSVKLAFWQCVVICLLISTLFGSYRSK